MKEPQAILPTAVYDAAQVRAVLRIGETKLKELVAGGAITPIAYSRTQLFWGEHLIRFCGRASK